MRSNRSKVDQIARAQRDGKVTGRFPPAALLAFVLHTAAVWALTPDELTSVIGPTGPEVRYGLVRDAVQALLSLPVDG